ncbi:uncharacterized protein LOC142220007 [Haematobia irritans]|uniref:uncharacterized protein LOC142220007 n=1 Tax=Haematobia irritans TaxID=7368 RepID=UPI003F4FB492
MTRKGYMASYLKKVKNLSDFLKRITWITSHANSMNNNVVELFKNPWKISTLGLTIEMIAKYLYPLSVVDTLPAFQCSISSSSLPQTHTLPPLGIKVLADRRYNI